MSLFKKCPPPVGKNESPVAKMLREKLAKASPVTLPDGLTYRFINKLTGYDLSVCETGSPPTLEQLAVIAKNMMVSDRYLEPMLVWATQDEVPKLVKVKPGRKKPYQVVRTPSLNCQAFTIWVLSEGTWNTIAPGAAYPVSSDRPSMKSVSIMAKTDPGVIGGKISAIARGEEELASVGNFTSTPSPYTLSLNGTYEPSMMTLKNSGTVTVYIKDIETQ